MSFLQELDISRVTKLSDDLERRVNLLDRLVDENILSVKHFIRHRLVILSARHRWVIAQDDGFGCSLDLGLSKHVTFQRRPIDQEDPAKL